MNNDLYFNESLTIKVYDGGKVIDTIEIDFDDYDRSYEINRVHGQYYDYYEGIDYDW